MKWPVITELECIDPTGVSVTSSHEVDVTCTRCSGVGQFDTYQDIRDSANPLVFTLVFAKGADMAGDGSSRSFYWDDTDTTSADDGSTVLVSNLSSLGHWKQTEF